MSLLLTIALSSLAGTPHAVLPGDLDDTLDRARAARFAQKLGEERELLEHAVTLEGDGHQLAQAGRRLAEIEWMYYLQDDAARERLSRATHGPEPAEAWRELARIDLAREHFTDARTAAANVIELAATAEVEFWGRVTHARTIVEAAVAARRAGERAPEGVAAAVHALTAIVREQPGRLDPARALVRGGVLTSDSAAVRLGWESYYHIAPDGHGPNAIDIDGMRAALERWPATTGELIALVMALSASRMFTEAELVALDPRAGVDVRKDPRVHEVIAYAETLHTLRRSITEYYRAVSLGDRDNRRLDSLLEQAWRDLGPELAGTDPSAPPTAREVRRIITERFGAKCETGQTGGFYGIHFGHIVTDETRPVEQYGHAGKLRFVALDNFVSNGFPGWTVEGGGGTGGWAGPDEIWQVRPGYAGRANEIWQGLMDDEARRRFADEIEKASAGDDERARRDPYAYLPGLSKRVLLQGVTRLYERLVASGLEGTALRDAFLHELESAVLESSIFAHEGRHAIDRHLKKPGYPAPNSEYTAKLSEIAFAPSPRLSLGAILSPGIGSSSRHGVANTEVMKGIVAWMSTHPDEISGFDPERPVLPQFDCLTDEQMRALFRSLDPLAGTR